MDSKISVDVLKQLVIDFRDERDWKQFHNPKDLAISISIEASELLELFQWKDSILVSELTHDPQQMQAVKDEIADIVIYCLSACDVLGIDLSDAIRDKLTKNSLKYPVEKAKGLAVKYKEL